MIEFLIEKIQDKYYLQNEGTLDISYTIQKLTSCTVFTTVRDGSVSPTERVELFFKEDGDYQIVLNDGTNPEFIVPIQYFLNLQMSIIENILHLVCESNCGCVDCFDIDSKDIYCRLLIARARMDAYKRLTSPQGESFYNAVYEYTKCLVLPPLYCGVHEEIIRGESNCNVELVKQLLSLDYLAMYFFEISQVSSTEDIDYVKNKFKVDRIFCCIQNLGINIEQIEQLINNNMGQFTINSASYVNQPPSQVGDITLSVGNRATTVITLAMLTTGTIPQYQDPEGDPVASVRIDSLPADGELRFNSNPVSVGQVIPVADVSNSLLVYVSPDQDGLDSDTFNFSLSDTGSGQFSS